MLSGFYQKKTAKKTGPGATGNAVGNLDFLRFFSRVFSFQAKGQGAPRGGGGSDVSKSLLFFES
jgi:hypothetical protein